MSLVSVIIPCYNQAEYLPEALESVFNQIYEAWECIIVNDGSTDHTELVAKEWTTKDKRYKYYRTSNSGLAASRNYGISKANGRFILPLDSDDKIHPEYLNCAIDAYTNNPDLKVVYCKLAYFGKEIRHELPPYNYKELLIQNMLFCSVIMKKEDILLVGGYDINMKYGFEDWELFINLLDDSSKVYRIERVMFFYRLKDQSMLLDLRESTEKQNMLFNYMSTKHYEKYTKTFGSIIENLQLIARLKEENTLLKSTIFNRMLYVGKSIWQRFA